MSRKSANDPSLKITEVHFRTTQRMRELLREKAGEEGITISNLIEKALSAYLVKDVMDESLLIAKMTEMARQVDRVKHDLELMQKFDLEKLQYDFLWAPEIDRTTMATRTETANKNVQNMLSLFRKRITQIKPLRDTLFGEMLEEDLRTTEGAR